MNIVETKLNRLSASMLDEATQREIISRCETSPAMIDNASHCYVELVKLGKCVKDYSPWMHIALPLVASAKLDSALVMRFIHQRTALEHIAKLPLSAQSHIKYGGLIDVVDPDTRECRQMTATDVRPKAWKLIVDVRGWITKEEQLKNLDVKRNKPVKERPARRLFSFNRETNELIIGKTKVPWDEISGFVASLKGYVSLPEQADMLASEKVDFTTDERHRLREKSIATKVSKSNILRRALYLAGVL